jgi:hypothetical protein
MARLSHLVDPRSIGGSTAVTGLCAAGGQSSPCIAVTPCRQV